MFLLNFYRSFFSIICGAIIFFVFIHKWWAWVFFSIIARLSWFFIELNIQKHQVNVLFKQHEADFKQLNGPYGIRIINKAETDWQIKKSLAEVFTNNLKNLKSAVEQLEVMNTMFQAGLRPDGDAYLLHDLKLKYGRHRLEKLSDQSK